MPSRPSFVRLMAPLFIGVALAMLACALAFKLVWPEVSAWKLVMPAVVGSLLVIAWMMIILRRRWVAPVRQLAEVAEQMAAGDWAARADVSGAEDAQSLAARLNHLATAAQQQLSDLDHQRSDLQQLVDSLPDPILLSDAQQRLILINTAASKLLQVSATQALGKKFAHVVSEAPILELFEALTPANAPPPTALPQREIRITRAGQRSYFQAVGTRTRAGGVLIVLRNVTTMASAIQMKTDFVANASHELRTPIAAIKIAFETLRDVHGEDPGQTQKCITIIDGHLNRLEEMLRDLLDLSRVESTDLKPQFRPVSAGELFTVVRQGLGPMARQKGVNLHFEGEPATQVASDRRLLDLILKNLVENSIKFTPPGGSVTIGIDTTPTDMTLRVADTGVGIPKEHLDRVFERFYQVEASRTGGASRGTGLGLAIVKHAIHALEGAVTITSAPGEGTTVVCTIPVGEAGESVLSAEELA
jgi:two-component system phosphate regulon sensor histidine kinase PhoR